MEKKIRTLRELEFELEVLKEKKKLQEANLKERVHGLKENLQPSSIISGLFSNFISSMFSHKSSDASGFGGSVKDALFSKLSGIIERIKKKFSAS